MSEHEQVHHTHDAHDHTVDMHHETDHAEVQTDDPLISIQPEPNSGRSAGIGIVLLLLAGLIGIFFAVDRVSNRIGQSQPQNSTEIDFSTMINIAGKGTPNAVVDVLVNDVPIDNVAVDGDGAWEYVMPYESIRAGGNMIHVTERATGEQLYDAAIYRTMPELTEISSFAQTAVFGTGQPDWHIGLQIDAGAPTLVETDVDGTWSHPLQMTPGQHEISVWSIDTNKTQIGNRSDQITVTIPE